MKDATRTVAAGRNPSEQSGMVNRPVYRASTIVHGTLDEFRNRGDVRPGDGLTYAIHGTPATYGFEELVAKVEGGYRTRLCNSGLQACTIPLLAYLSSGDHLLITDSVYGPTRSFANTMLRRMGIETTYYDPLIGGGIRDLIQPNTKVVFTESPGSWTFEVQDIPAIAEEAHKAGAVVIMDNSWATPLYFKPFEHGVDVSVHAITKYIGGHSDVLMGCVTTTEEAYGPIQKAWQQIGLCGSPDDTFLAARGMRSLDARMERHHRNGLVVANWLMEQPQVAEVIHPAMEHDPGYAIWKRDFLGSASLFAFTLKEEFSSDDKLRQILDHSEHFSMGASWGGYESLLIPIEPETQRTATPWPKPGRAKGQTMRIHVGLEDPSDLIDDLAAGFKRMG
ncbi:cystathionine beta-lyase [Rhodobacteraceae bacterium NNCM2]|nr:cystathionine beta-lyase [Coraliihabitans acroporae]